MGDAPEKEKLVEKRSETTQEKKEDGKEKRINDALKMLSDILKKRLKNLGDYAQVKIDTTEYLFILSPGEINIVYKNTKPEKIGQIGLGQLTENSVTIWIKRPTTPGLEKAQVGGTVRPAAEGKLHIYNEPFVLKVLEKFAKILNEDGASK